MRAQNFLIGTRRVGEGAPCFIIAEAGVNHNGSLSLARELIEAAAEAGADVVKFQTFRTEDVVTEDAPKASYQKQTTGVEESQANMLRKLELPNEFYPELLALAKEKKLIFLSTPFGVASVDFLADLGMPAFKIPSGEITHPALLSRMAAKHKPLLISTGMSTLEEVEEAVRLVEARGAREFCLLQCTSNYPANPADVNLRAMITMRQHFGVPVGLSDHTEGFEVSLAAVALGAAVIEKHLTLDRSLPGPDQAASMEPDEFAIMVRGIRKVEASLGDGRKIPAASELGVAAVARRSMVAARTLPAGTVLTAQDISFKRPGTGMLPSALPKVLGKTMARDLAAGHLLSLEDLR
jgi:N-acetylneuraminate synthase